MRALAHRGTTSPHRRARMSRFVQLCFALLLLVSPFAHAGKVETNVTLSSYWVSNDKYFHSNALVNLEGVTGTAWPDSKFKGTFRADFIGPMTVTVDWKNVTKRQLMNVRGMSWGQVNLGTGNGGPKKSWAWRRAPKTAKRIPLNGIWNPSIDLRTRPR